MKGTSSVRRVRLRSVYRFFLPQCNGGFKLLWVCLCVRSSIVFCNSVSADRIGVAASRLLGAAAACVILLSFAAEDCKSYWSGCIQAAIVICQQIFPILALIIFLLKFLVKSASKSSFFRFGIEIHPVLELQFPTPLHVVLLCFATQSLQIALEWLRQGCLVQRLRA